MATDQSLPTAKSSEAADVVRHFKAERKAITKSPKKKVSVMPEEAKAKPLTAEKAVSDQPPKAKPKKPKTPAVTPVIDRSTYPKLPLPHRVGSDLLERIEDEREYQRKQGNKVHLQTIADEALHLGLMVLEKRHKKPASKSLAVSE